jgi:hypothetical protein
LELFEGLSLSVIMLVFYMPLGIPSV